MKVALIAVVTLGVGLAWLLFHNPPSPPTPSPQAVEKLPPPKVEGGKFKEFEATEKEVSFKLEGGKKAGNRFYLNSLRNWKDPRCVTVIVDLEKVPEFAGVNTIAMRGYTIKAKGEVTERGILVTNVDNLHITK